MRKFLAVTFIVAVSVFAVAAMYLSVRGDSVAFTPAVASVVDHAECTTPDISGPLSGLAQMDSQFPPTTEPGYPPSDFEPVALIRCERGENAAGGLTIDAVRLEGDVSAVAEAFRTDSQRFRDNISADCAIREIVPVGLWFVDASGNAFRPAWPSAPCGFQDAPLETLDTLHEVSRQQHPIDAISADEPGICTTSIGSLFDLTTPDDVERSVRSENTGYSPLDSPLATPVDDVGRLQVCRYNLGQGSSHIRLTLADSAELMHAASTAPIAPPCDQIAQQVASIDLRRADGSGGTQVLAELDGCQRIRFGGYRQIPTSITELLSR
ncbi:hypothetical protein C7T36_08485 [Rhodococcus sp. AD45-ID]|uniref:hypothetical protein n=1 Tax=unclassified Rhodococcus (in: high G+C Gram-positive bacteria) TaxID=192944 RepID=UPI0005D45440|nr:MULTISPECIES: hypothetical protein [unclassified Rhodococcus (in: high G+C Gram-positive bacteria)]KJF23847.1 hypothetical protein SZ00_00765 [Rhodococcus sp. AD45]PSR42225.1 hypothetical protein C7T36_08485 [Rhodococcus sp. AD45-ID]